MRPIKTTVQRFVCEAIFELIDKESLSAEERIAIDAAIHEHDKSVNPKWRVGAAAVAEDGTMVSVHNNGGGTDGHAEQRVLTKLYGELEVGKKKLKLIALAGARIGEDVVSIDKPYGDDITLDQIEWMRPCGKCLEFIHDCTFNVPDVAVLSVTVTGQIMRTSLRSLLTNPHTSFRVPIQVKDGKVHPVPSTDKNKDDCNGNGH